MATYADYTDMPVKEWLEGLVPIDITEGCIDNILFERGIEADAVLEDTTKKQRDLCKADLYIWCALTPSISGTVKDADGGWSHSEGGTQMTLSDKRILRKMALRLYRKYGETQESLGTSSININNHGIKMF